MFTRAGCIKASIVIALLVLVGAAVCYFILSTKPPPPGPETPSAYENQVRIGITGSTSDLPFYALNSLIKGKGFEIVLVPIKDLSRGWELLAAGSLDIMAAPLDAVTLGMLRQKPGLMLFRVSRSAGCDALAGNKEIKDLEGLRGKRIAIIPGSTGYMLLTLLLDRTGRTVQDCQIVNVENQETALRRLQSGTVDAAVLADPFLQSALDKGFKIIASSDAAPVIEEYCVAGRKMKENYPDRIRDLVKAWFEILEIMEKNPGMGKRLISKDAGITPMQADQRLQRIQFSYLKENKELSDKEIIRKMQTYRKFWSLEGEPNAHLPIEFKDCLDLSFVRELNPEEIQSVFTDDMPPSPSPSGSLPLPALSSTPKPPPLHGPVLPSPHTETIPAE